MNVNIEQTWKQCATCLDHQHTQPHKCELHYEVPYKPWKVVGTDIFMVYNKALLCMADYCSEFPTVKNVAGLSADDLVHTTKLISAEFGLPKRIISDASTLYFRNIQGILKKDEHPTVCNILLSPLKQWPSRGLH